MERFPVEAGSILLSKNGPKHQGERDKEFAVNLLRAVEAKASELRKTIPGFTGLGLEKSKDADSPSYHLILLIQGNSFTRGRRIRNARKLLGTSMELQVDGRSTWLKVRVLLAGKLRYDAATVTGHVVPNEQKPPGFITDAIGEYENWIDPDDSSSTPWWVVVLIVLVGLFAAYYYFRYPHP